MNLKAEGQPPLSIPGGRPCPACHLRSAAMGESLLRKSDPHGPRRLAVGLHRSEALADVGGQVEVGGGLVEVVGQSRALDAGEESCARVALVVVGVEVPVAFGDDQAVGVDPRRRGEFARFGVGDLQRAVRAQAVEKGAPDGFADFGRGRVGEGDALLYPFGARPFVLGERLLDDLAERPARGGGVGRQRTARSPDGSAGGRGGRRRSRAAGAGRRAASGVERSASPFASYFQRRAERVVRGRRSRAGWCGLRRARPGERRQGGLAAGPELRVDREQLR